MKMIVESMMECRLAGETEVHLRFLKGDVIELLK
jgi:hypothetical protein